MDLLRVLDDQHDLAAVESNSTNGPDSSSAAAPDRVELANLQAMWTTDGG